MTSLATLPGFLLYFIVGLALLVGGLMAYQRITPHDEMRLIRAGNTAAAVALAGVMIGLTLPISSAFAHSVNIVDAVVWGLVALLVQLACFFAVSKLLGAGWRDALERGEMAGAVVKAAASVAVGMLNAACLST
jgi:putative membrane protein